MQSKQYHFEAAAQYRKSVDDLEANRFEILIHNTRAQSNLIRSYGHELARLAQAQKTVTEAYDCARKGGVMAAVVQDISVRFALVAPHPFG